MAAVTVSEKHSYSSTLSMMVIYVGSIKGRAHWSCRIVTLHTAVDSSSWTVILADCFLKGKCFSPSLGLEKPMHTSVRSTSSPNLVQIGCETAPPRGGEIYRFCDFLFSVSSASPLPTGRNFGPNCTLNGSKVVLRLIHVHFEGLVPSNLLWGVFGTQNRQIWTRKILDDFLQSNRFNVRAAESITTLKRTPIQITFLIKNYKLGINFS